MKKALVIALAVVTLLSSGCGMKKRTVVDDTYGTETVYVFEVFGNEVIKK